MSSSNTMVERVQLSVHAECPQTEIIVIDGNFARVAEGVKDLTLELAPGIYKVKYKAGSLTREEHVTLMPGSQYKNIVAPDMPLASSAPLQGIETTHDGDALDATRHSLEPSLSVGEGSQLFLLTRDLEGKGSQNAAADLTLHTIEGRLLVDFSQMKGPRVGCTVDLDPGSYRLRVRAGAVGKLEQIIHTCKGWQTQIFLLSRPYLGSREMRRADLVNAALLMARIGVGFDPTRPDLKWTEIARLVLADRHAGLATEKIDQMLCKKFDNPLLGIYGAHLLLLSRGPDRVVLRTIIEYLQELVPAHPDVQALELWLDHRRAPACKFAVPPMLSSSWRIIINASVYNQDIVPAGSLGARIADRLWGSGAWLIWHAPPDAQVSRKTKTFDLSELSKVFSKIIEKLPDDISDESIENAAQKMKLNNLERSLLAHLLRIAQLQKPVISFTKSLDMIKQMQEAHLPLSVEAELSDVEMVQALSVPRAVISETMAGLLRKMKIKVPSARPVAKPVTAVAFGRPDHAAAAEQEQTRITKSGNVEFEAIEYKHLKKVCVVAQSLDNQWVPRGLLSRMLDQGLSLADVQQERERAVRSEYVRALINAEQVVINRAYLYNNPVVFQDYTGKGPDREAFKEFLKSGVIVPYLFNETSPVDEPAYRTLRFQSWSELAQEVRMQCVRLSWGDDNASKIDDLLAVRFHLFPRTAMDRNPDVFLYHLNLPLDKKDEFRRRLKQMSDISGDFSMQDKKITREDLYKHFVVADDTSPAEGRYDRNKPFAGEIKQLLDLCYNMNLPDALGRYALTPFDSLPRTALQEWQGMKEEPIKIGDLVTLLSRTAFDLVQGGLFLESFGLLSLVDVQEVRRMEEWTLYMESMDELIRNPLEFAESNTGASAVYHNYINLAQAMTRYLANRRMEEWAPVIELQIDIAGAILSVRWTNYGMQYQAHGSVSGLYRPGEAPVVARMNIRDVSGQGKQADLATNIDFMRGHVEDAKKQWQELISKVKELDGIREIPPEATEEKPATLNQPQSNTA